MIYEKPCLIALEDREGLVAQGDCGPGSGITGDCKAGNNPTLKCKGGAVDPP